MKNRSTPYVRKNRVFQNGNVTVAIDKDEIAVMKATDTACHDSIRSKILEELDTEFDMVPVSDNLESFGDAEGWRLFSYKTMKEYVLLVSDLDMCLLGKCIRLTAAEPSDETYAEMVWQST